MIRRQARLLSISIMSVAIVSVLSQGFAAEKKKTATKTASQAELHEYLAMPEVLPPEEEIWRPSWLAMRRSRWDREYDGLFSRMQGGPGHQMGIFKVKPHIQSISTFSDNVFATHHNQMNDYQTLLRPAVDVEIPFIMGKPLVVGFGAEFLRSLKQPDEFNNDTAHFAGRAGTELEFGKAVKLTISEAYSSGSTRPDGENDQLHFYNDNVASAKLNYDFGDKWGIELAYAFSTRSFDDESDAVDNYREHSGTIRVNYRIMPKTRVFADYTLSRIQREIRQERENWTQTGAIGLGWDPTRKIRGTVRVGYMQKSYDGPARDNVFGRWGYYNRPDSLDHVSSIFYEVNARYTPTRRLALYLVGRRQIDETNLRDEELQYGDYFISTSGYLGAQYLLTSRLVLVGRAGVADSDYSESNMSGKSRRDQQYQGSIGLLFQLTRRISISLEGTRIDNVSTIDDHEFKEDRVTLGINADL